MTITAVTKPLPDTAFNRARSQGHLNRLGHDLGEGFTHGCPPGHGIIALGTI